jgi:hypothetical protein
VLSLATPGTEACDAVGAALRPQCRECQSVRNYGIRGSL